MIVTLIIVCWALSSVIALVLVWPLLKSAKIADELSEEHWGEIEHFDKRI